MYKKTSSGGRRKSLNEVQKQYICNEVDQNAAITLKCLKEKVLLEFNIAVSISTIDRALREFHFTLKLIIPTPAARNSEEVLDNRRDYARRFLNFLDDDKIVFVDEAGISCSTRRKVGRARIGQEARQVVQSIRSKNYSICACIAVDQLFFYEATSVGYNGDRFCDYLVQLFNYFEQERKQNMIVIMDNVKFHKVEKVRTLFSQNGHRLEFLPPYSPFLNPIENMFSQLKSKIKELSPKNEDELYKSVEEGSLLISSNNCRNYFRNMRSYLPRCMDREPILG